MENPYYRLGWLFNNLAVEHRRIHKTVTSDYLVGRGVSGCGEGHVAIHLKQDRKLVPIGLRQDSEDLRRLVEIVLIKLTNKDDILVRAHRGREVGILERVEARNLPPNSTLCNRSVSTEDSRIERSLVGRNDERTLL
jgi:hypothetical protein